MFVVMYRRSPLTADFDHFTLLFCRGRQRNLLTCKTLEQSVQSYCFWVSIHFLQKYWGEAVKISIEFDWSDLVLNSHDLTN